MIYSLKLKKDVILNVSLDFVLLVLKLCPIRVVISLPLWIKLTMGQLLLFFLCNFSSFFSYVGGILVTNHFSRLLIDRCTLTIQQIITHEEHLRYSFWSVPIFWNPSETLAPLSKQKEVAKKVIFTNQFLPKVSLFWCMLCTATQNISSSKENINRTAPCFQTIFPFLMTMMEISSWIH